MIRRVAGRLSAEGAGEVDRAHAALADPGEEPVAGDLAGVLRAQWSQGGLVGLRHRIPRVPWSRGNLSMVAIRERDAARSCGGSTLNSVRIQPGTCQGGLTGRPASASSGGLGCTTMTTGTASRHTRIGYPVLF
ncbi:hypothetical protein ACZ90_50165 [Streptomyces albus subsp. albus]|nr:hypothetical protein ACZ90_50165 [Streptomyces albus subsp. albus]